MGGWVEFTEQFPFAPRLYEKIAGITPVRRHERYRSFLVKIQGLQCFYCGGQKDRGLHVDHVIPWSFVLEDRVWNLVLACQSCNSAKCDRTPDDQVFARLLTRNKEIVSELRESIPAVKLDKQVFTPEALDTHIDMLLENCRAEGFGIWSRHGPAGESQPPPE